MFDQVDFFDQFILYYFDIILIFRYYMIYLKFYEYPYFKYVHFLNFNLSPLYFAQCLNRRY